MAETGRSSGNEITRRAFVGGVMSVALVATGVSALPGIAQADDAFLRPPGAREGAEFFSRCIRCGRCRSVCPKHGIVAATVEDGFAQARTPMMDYAVGYCDLCHRCADVCPTGAIADFDPDAVVIGLARIDTDICLAWNRGGCKKCKEVCPEEAIVLDGSGRPLVVDVDCTGCGECEYRCPASVYRGFQGKGKVGVRVVPVGLADEAGPAIAPEGVTAATIAAAEDDAPDQGRDEGYAGRDGKMAEAQARAEELLAEMDPSSRANADAQTRSDS